VSVGLKGS